MRRLNVQTGLPAEAKRIYSIPLSTPLALAALVCTLHDDSVSLVKLYFSPLAESD